MANSDRLLPNDCEHFQTLISAELDGELVGEEWSRLHSHLRTCPDCAQFRVGCRELAWRLAESQLAVIAGGSAPQPAAEMPVRVNGTAGLPAGGMARSNAAPAHLSPRAAVPWRASPWLWAAIAAGLMFAIIVSASWQLRRQAPPQFSLDPLLVRYANNVEAEEDQQATLKLVQMDLRTMRLELKRLNLDPETRAQLEKRIASLLTMTNQLTQSIPTSRGDLR